ncbi:hypothetical protein MMC31_000702, partial [Peltigera leucophlebia]|nr:hypothetical protein [Peltigera leucophlebia]
MQSDRNIAISRLISAFCAAWLSLQLLNKPFGVKGESLKLKVDSAQEINATNGVSPVSEEEFLKEMSIPLAGKTIDLTLFAVTRSLESIVGQLWNRHKLSRVSRGKWTKLETLISHFTDASVFAISSGMIMWAWIYYPSTLPRAYDRWIGGVAQVDQRLIEILREFRTAIDVYGPDARPNNILEGMCTDYSCPLEWADPSKTIPAPCELVHSGIGPSCSWHAIVRFSRAFKIAIMTYLPLQLLLKIRNPSRKALLRALREAFRSSAFLGAFVALFWTGVCLARTRLGPRLFSPRITPSMWDQGLCIRAGCLLCGWSILIEAARRRQEVAFFVAPKAAATLLPRRYDLKYIWREKAAFSASVAILFTFAHDNPAKVRGMLGPLLHQ